VLVPIAAFDCCFSLYNTPPFKKSLTIATANKMDVEESTGNVNLVSWEVWRQYGSVHPVIVGQVRCFLHPWWMEQWTH
jgi:hypothetical protein